MKERTLTEVSDRLCGQNLYSGLYAFANPVCAVLATVSSGPAD